MSDKPHYFSNGTEFYDMWQVQWCQNCAHDHDFSHFPEDTGEGCDLLVLAAIGEEVPEWTVDDRFVGDPVLRVRCREYEPCSCPERDSGVRVMVPVTRSDR